MSITLDPGTSGAPVFNSSYEVVALNMGEVVVNDHPLAATNFGLTISQAIHALSPDADTIKNVSYAASCGAQLGSPRVGTSLTASSSLGLGAITQRFVAPSGYSIVAARDPTSTATGTSKLTVRYDTGHFSADRSSYELPIRVVSIETDRRRRNTQLGPIVSAVIASLLPVAQSNLPIVPVNGPSPVIESTSIAQIYDDHYSLDPTVQTYNETIPALPGYIFSRVRQIRTLTAKNSPSNGVNVIFSPDNRNLLVTYSLKSGYVFDWSGGELDAVIDSELVPDPSVQ
jgi:hypothetical protein